MTYQNKLICPSCYSDIVNITKGLSCSNCNIVFPTLDHIPFLFPNSSSMIQEWKQQYDQLIKKLDMEAEQAKALLTSNSQSKLTIKRLQKQIQGFVEQKKSIIEILKAFDLQEDSSKTSIDIDESQLQSTQKLLTYYTNILRDWSWGEEENQITLSCIKEILPLNNLGSTITIGSGACRFPYEINRTYPMESMLAVDINPLMLIAGRKIMNGKTLNLYEFPIGPKNLESYAAKCRCKAPERIQKNFDFLFCDFSKRNFQAKSFDTVMTPWLIDILPMELSNTIERINHIITDDGLWVNLGSIALHEKNLDSNYSVEEVLELIEEKGFQILKYGSKPIPYLNSPHSRYTRIEDVFYFTAKKIKHHDQIQEFHILPTWLRDTTEAVPLSRSLQMKTIIHSIYSDVLSLIDGKRSIRDIAEIFGPKQGLKPDEAEASIRRFMNRTYKELGQDR